MRKHEHKNCDCLQAAKKLVQYSSVHKCDEDVQYITREVLR